MRRGLGTRPGNRLNRLSAGLPGTARELQRLRAHDHEAGVPRREPERTVGVLDCLGRLTRRKGNLARARPAWREVGRDFGQLPNGERGATEVAGGEAPQHLVIAGPGCR